MVISAETNKYGSLKKMAIEERWRLKKDGGSANYFLCM